MATDRIDQQEFEQVRQRIAAMDNEFSSWRTHYQEINDWIFPRRFRYLQTERNKGFKKNDRIINNTPTRAVGVISAGMETGLTSPARPWWRPDETGDQEVDTWLRIVYEAINSAFARSNLYRCLHEAYAMEASFGTGVFVVEEDEITDVRGYALPVGQYRLGSSGRGVVDTFSQIYSMTALQLVKRFGRERCSPAVQNAYDNRRFDEWHDVRRIVEPNPGREYGKRDKFNMPFRSIWWEDATSTLQQPLLISGYEEFPLMVFRWYVTGEDVYGSGSPGMESLGDCKALQTLERRKATTVDLLVKPPMGVPMSMRATRLSLCPGDQSPIPEGSKDTVRPLVDQAPLPNATREARESIKEHEQRINATFFVQLFQMMIMDDRQQPSTAREINERHEEKMLMLGPVVERNEDEGLAPLINRVAKILFRRGKIPPPPPQALGAQFKVEFISIMAQAQKMMGTAGIERFCSFMGSLSAVKKNILDNLNEDEVASEYAKMLGVPPRILNPKKVVEQLRQARAQQEQAAQMAQAAPAMAQAAKAASETELDKGSMLDRLMGSVGVA